MDQVLGFLYEEWFDLQGFIDFHRFLLPDDFENVQGGNRLRQLSCAAAILHACRDRTTTQHHSMSLAVGGRSVSSLSFRAYNESILRGSTNYNWPSWNLTRRDE